MSPLCRPCPQINQFAQHIADVHNGHMSKQTFPEWLASLPGAPTPSQAAEVARLPRPTLLRHAERERTTAENAIAIARAFKVSPADALVEMGFLEPAEVNASDKLAVREALARAEWEDIFAEITTRVNASGMFEGDFELSIDSPVHIPEPADLEEKRAWREVGVEKQFKGASWRDNPKPGRDGYAADSSEREPQMGDDGHHDGP